MIEFMYEGGWAMWGTLALFLGSAAVAVMRRGEGGQNIALAGAVLTLSSGVLGFSTGLYATVKYLDQVADPDKAEILAIGIRESANNTLLAGALATLLGFLALGLPRFAKIPPSTP